MLLQKNVLGIAGILILIALPAYSQESTPDVTLGKIMVTPYRYQETLDKTAASVTVIGQKEIRNSNASQVVDLLKSVPGVTVRDLYGNGTKAAVDIAGFGEQAFLNVLVLIDGRRANDVDLSGVDWSQIPLDQVERVEVMRGGSGGVLYGDNASSGVINIITKKGYGPLKVDMGAAYGSYAQNTQKISLSGDVPDKFSYWLSSSRDATNGYRKNTYNKAQDFASQFEYNATDVLSAHFSSGFHAATYGMPGAIYPDLIAKHGRRYARFSNDHANNKDYYFLSGAKLLSSEWGGLDVDFSFRRKNTDSYFLSSGNPTRQNKIDTYGLTPKYTLSHRLLDRDNKLITGIDYYRSYFKSDSRSTNPDWPDENFTSVNKSSFAGYVQDEFSILEQLIMSSGYRYEMARYGFIYHDENPLFPGYTNPSQDTKTRFNMQAFDTGLIYSYQEESNIFVNVGKSFRFPEVDEFTYQDEDYIQQLNTRLKPQSSINYEAGVRQKVNDRLKGSLAFFRMNVKDELYFNAAGGPYGYGQNENYSHTVHEGIETSVEGKLNDWIRPYGNYTFTNAYFDGGPYNRKKIPMVPQSKGSLGVRMLFSKEITWNVLGTYVGERYFQNDQANAYSRLNGYAVADTNISWRHKNWAVTFAINNLFDNLYSDTAGVRLTEDSVYGYHVGDKFYFPSPGRNFSLKVDCSF